MQKIRREQEKKLARTVSQMQIQEDNHNTSQAGFKRRYRTKNNNNIQSIQATETNNNNIQRYNQIPNKTNGRGSKIERQKTSRYTTRTKRNNRIRGEASKSNSP